MGKDKPLTCFVPLSGGARTLLDMLLYNPDLRNELMEGYEENDMEYPTWCDTEHLKTAYREGYLQGGNDRIPAIQDAGQEERRELEIQLTYVEKAIDHLIGMVNVARAQHGKKARWLVIPQ